MEEKKQQAPDPKIKIEDLNEEQAAAATAGENVTGGAGVTGQQSFDTKNVGGPLKGEEKVGLVWK